MTHLLQALRQIEAVHLDTAHIRQREIRDEQDVVTVRFLSGLSPVTLLIEASISLLLVLVRLFL